jgi:hypothetical protein
MVPISYETRELLAAVRDGVFRYEDHESATVWRRGGEPMSAAELMADQRRSIREEALEAAARFEGDHFPPSLPRLTWFGHPADVTSGDVDALLAGCARILRGEAIASDVVRNDRVVPLAVAMNSEGAVDVVIDGARRTFASAYDALVYAYGEINCWQTASAAFEGRS